MEKNKLASFLLDCRHQPDSYEKLCPKLKNCPQLFPLLSEKNLFQELSIQKNRIQLAELSVLKVKLGIKSVLGATPFSLFHL